MAQPRTIWTKEATVNKIRSRAMRVALTVFAVSATVVPVGAAHASPKAAAPPVTTRIALSALGPDFRVTLIAIRGPGQGGGSPAATVKIAAYTRSAGKWKLIGRQLIGQSNAWFWNVVTGDDAICQFSTSSVSPYPIEVRLLTSDSIGCSAVTYNFHVDKYGAFVAG